MFEGDSVLIYVHSLPENLLAFAWFKGLTNMKRRIVLYELNNNLSLLGPEYSGRETAMDPCGFPMSPTWTQDSISYEPSIDIQELCQ